MKAKISEDHIKEWLDLGAGLGLLVPGFEERIMGAMLALELQGSAEKLEHVAALAIAHWNSLGGMPDWVPEKYMKLSKEFHQNYCSECHG